MHDMQTSGSRATASHREADRLQPVSRHSSLRAKRSNPECHRTDSLDCFGAEAPRNAGEITRNNSDLWLWIPAFARTAVKIGARTRRQTPSSQKLMSPNLLPVQRRHHPPMQLVLLQKVVRGALQ